MILTAELQIPTRVIQQQLASAIRMVVQEPLLQDGSRKIIRINGIKLMERIFDEVMDANL